LTEGFGFAGGKAGLKRPPPQAAIDPAIGDRLRRRR
jgi:hypothetical protein